MATTNIANLKGDKGDIGATGLQGLPGVNATANDTATAGYITTAGTSLTKTALQNRYKQVVKIQGVGDGVADDTAAIQAALDSAGSTVGQPTTVEAVPGSVYKITRIRLRSNVTLDLRGATLKGSTAAVSAMVESPALSATGHIDDATITNGVLDMDNIGYAGVWLADATRVTVSNLRILNLKANSSTGIRVGEDTINCLIENNTIPLVIDEPYGTVPSSVGISCTSAIVDDQSGGQNATLAFVEPTKLSTGHIITRNTISGGTHGIALIGASRIIVTDNKLTTQSHRGIILSPRVVDSIISDNSVIDFRSTGIHMAWGCERVTISGNNLFTTKSAGEGDGIKGYYACKDISVTGNFIQGVTNGGVRFAMASDRFTIAGNTMRSCAAGVVIEASITGAGYYLPASNGQVAGGSIVGNSMFFAAEGIRLSQYGAHELKRIQVSANHSYDAGTHLKITEITANRVTNVDLLSNAFLGSGTPMVAARGMLHFRQAVGNGAGIDTKFGNPVTVAAAATDPATTMALANDLRAKLVAMGMLS